MNLKSWVNTLESNLWQMNDEREQLLAELNAHRSGSFTKEKQDETKLTTNETEIEKIANAKLDKIFNEQIEAEITDQLNTDDSVETSGKNKFKKKKKKRPKKSWWNIDMSIENMSLPSDNLIESQLMGDLSVKSIEEYFGTMGEAKSPAKEVAEPPSPIQEESSPKEIHRQ